jgi:uncharacterized protein GlcG (DUF336 family)
MNRMTVSRNPLNRSVSWPRLAFLGLMVWAGGAHAQATMGIGLDQANRAVSAALAEARKQNLSVAVAVVDAAGQLVAFERMDNAFPAATAVSQDKAQSAAMFRRPTKAYQDALAGGGAGLRVLTLRGAIAVEGGIPLIVDSKVVGAIGVSGGSPEQDGAVAKAGADGLAK